MLLDMIQTQVQNKFKMLYSYSPRLVFYEHYKLIDTYFYVYKPTIWGGAYKLMNMP